MRGAIVGDIVGSRFENDPHKNMDFELFSADCRFTDDTVLTLAVADALMTGTSYNVVIRQYYRRYPDAGYGRSFRIWGNSPESRPYGSFGNGSAMRVSAVAWLRNDLAAVLDEARRSAEVTHNHSEGIKGAQSVAAAILLARHGKSKADIRCYLEQKFKYDLSRSLAAIRPGYSFDVTCQGSVPEAIICFLEADSCEQAIRNAVSLGGDADTQAAIAGSIAEAFFGLPDELWQQASGYLDDFQCSVVDKFRKEINL